MKHTRSVSASPRDVLTAMHAVVFSIGKIADQLLSRHLDISFAQFRLLMVLDATHENPLPQAAIARALDVTESAVSRHIQTLTTAGLLLARRNSTSRRTNDIIITKRGANIKDKALILLEAETQEIMRGVGIRERKMTLHLLHTVTHTLSKRYPDSLCCLDPAHMHPSK